MADSAEEVTVAAPEANADVSLVGVPAPPPPMAALAGSDVSAAGAPELSVMEAATSAPGAMPGASGPPVQTMPGEAAQDGAASVPAEPGPGSGQSGGAEVEGLVVAAATKQDPLAAVRPGAQDRAFDGAPLGAQRQAGRPSEAPGAEAGGLSPATASDSPQAAAADHAGITDAGERPVAANPSASLTPDAPAEGRTATLDAAAGPVAAKSAEPGSAAHAGAAPHEVRAGADHIDGGRAAAETAHGAAQGTSVSDVNAPAKPPGAGDQPQAGSEPKGLPSHLSAPGQAAGQAPAASPLPPAPIRVVADVPLHAVPIEIGLKSLAGVNHFEIRLDPGDLGRIEVRLEIDKDGEVKAHLSVDRVETLALLQRDAKTLERAFEQAGLKPSDGGVNLTLRDQQSQGQGRHEQAAQHERGERGPRTQTAHPADDQAGAKPVTRRLSWGVTGIDVRV